MPFSTVMKRAVKPRIFLPKYTKQWILHIGQSVYICESQDKAYRFMHLLQHHSNFDSVAQFDDVFDAWLKRLPPHKHCRYCGRLFYGKLIDCQHCVANVAWWNKDPNGGKNVERA